MTVFDANGNKITLAEMAAQIRDALALDQEMWVRPDVAEDLIQEGLAVHEDQTTDDAAGPRTGDGTVLGS